MGVSKMDEDIKDVAKRLIQGNEKRKKRIRYHKESEFDVLAARAIADALASSCGNITSPTIRRQVQEKIYKSIVLSTPYEYIGETYCGRRQFYDYRNEFILAVADNLGMVPPKEPGGRNEATAAAGEERKEGCGTLIQAPIAAGKKAGQN